MAGVAGRSGKKLDSLWGDAIRRAIKRREEDDPHALEKLAERLLDMAMSDGPQALGALKELGDRLDGKAHQSLDVTTTHERSASELPESELDAAIAAARAARIAGGEKAPAGGKAKSDRVH